MIVTTHCLPTLPHSLTTAVCLHLVSSCPDLLAITKELTEKVIKIANDTSAMQSKLTTLIRPDPLLTSSQHKTRSASANTPLSPDIIIVESSESQQTPEHQDSSNQTQPDNSFGSDSNTIDDHVPDDLNSPSHLNCSVLTNQLPQLMHSNPREPCPLLLGI